MAGSLFESEVVEFPQGVIVRLRGEIRLDAAEAEVQFNRLSARRAAVIILDLTDLSFISSLGMGFLVSLSKSMSRQGGCLRIASVQPMVLEALNRVRLGDLLTMFSSVDLAMKG